MSIIGIQELIINNIDKIELMVDTFIKSSIKTKKKIIQGLLPEKAISILLRDTYMCNILNRYIGMMTLLSTDPRWETLDNTMGEYIQNYFYSNNLKKSLEKILRYYKKTGEKEYCCFLQKMIEKCITDKKILHVRKQIRMLENKILNLISTDPDIKIHSSCLSHIPKYTEINSNNIEISLTHDNYYELINNVQDIKLRHRIENQFSSRTKNINNEINKLILNRIKLANLNGYSTYFNYVNRLNNNDTIINSYITDINNKIDKNCQNEIDKIYNFYTRINNKHHKISISDIIQYNFLHKNNSKYHPNHVFDTLMIILNRYFNLTFVKNDSKTWHNDVNVYSVIDTDTKQCFGKVFIDIFHRDDKRTSDIISLHLSDRIVINDNEFSNTEVAVIANYSNSECMTYIDIVSFFREFGYVLYYLCCNTKVGLLNYDNKFSNYIPLLMEYIAWDIDTIGLICNNDITSIDHIKMDRETDMYINLKIKCINAKYDYILNNNVDLIKNITNNKNIITDLYIKIYNELLSDMSNNMVKNIMYINPLSIVYEINGLQGKVYSNLINDMYAYSTYFLIKEKNITSFRKEVLENGIDDYNVLLKNFLSKTKIDYYNNYIKNVIKTNCIDDYITEETNFFDDRQTDNESDKEEIITITRI